MWGIAAIAVVDRYGDPAFLKIFFHPSLTLGPPSFSSSASANESPSICIDSSPDKNKNSSSSTSYFSVEKEDVLSIHLLLFAALDKSESVLVEEVRKRMAAEGGMDRSAALRRNGSWKGAAPIRWKERKSLDGVKKDPLKRIVDVDGFLLISPFSPAHRMEGMKSTSARRETVPFVEQHSKSMEGEKATYFSEDGQMEGEISLSPRVEWERYRTSFFMNPSSSLFSHRSFAGIPSSIFSSPATPLSLDHPHSPRVVSPFGEAEDTPFMGTPRIHSSPCRASTDLRAWSPKGSTRRRTRFSPLITTHAASSTEVATTCTSSPTSGTTVRTSTSTSYSSSHSSSRSSSSTDEYSHSSSSSSASPPHSFASPLSLSPSPSPSLHRDPHQWVEKEPAGRAPSPARFPPDKLAATTKYSSETPARTMPLSASPSLHGPQPLPSERREEKEKSTASRSNSPPLLWISASPSPSSFSSFPFPSHPSNAVSHTTEGSAASIAPPAEPQYLGKVAASSDERFQCYACCAGTGMRVFVVTVTRRRCRARFSSLRSASSFSSTSDGTLEEQHQPETMSLHHTIQEEATQKTSGRTPCALSATKQRRKAIDVCLSGSSSFSAYSSISEEEDEEEEDALLHREGNASLLEEEGSEPSDDAMIPITRSILESASIASCNPLNSSMKASRLSSVHSPFPSILEDAGPFFSRESPHFLSTTGLHSRLLPSLTSLKTVLLNSRSFQLQLERIIASLEFTS